VVRAAAERALGAARVLDMPPVPPSDDVSILMERVPGCFFFVGAAHADGRSGMHHSPTFAIDEEALRAGALVMADAAVDLAARA
jgi:metal-dependent amidase/aminoacylase/carboxypeptidase family protein